MTKQSHFKNKSVGQASRLSISLFLFPLIGQLVNRYIGQSVNYLIGKLGNRLIGELKNLLNFLLLSKNSTI
jgi:hypothetical protein